MLATITTLLFSCLCYANPNPEQEPILITGTWTTEARVAPIQVQGKVEVEQKADNAEALPAVSKYRLMLGFYTLFFTTIPLCVCVLYIIRVLSRNNGKTSDSLIPFFGDGQLGQYLVIILVAGNVCTLAIVGILGRSEVAAIYGGIIGYVLGKKCSNGTRPTDHRTNGTHTPGQEPKA